MDFWKTLDIKPTNDVREIKRAYARELHLCNPEDDPASFIRLREAFEQALAYAQQSASSDESTKHTRGSSDISPEPLPEAVERSQLAWQKLTALYVDFDRRMDLDEWQELIGKASLSDLQTMQSVMISFLNSHYALPSSVWYYLDAEFDFSSDTRFRWAPLMEPQHDVCAGVSFLFKNFPAPECNRANYVQLRVNTYIAFQLDDWSAAEDFSRQAIDLYNKDYLVCGIRGDALSNLGSMEESAEAYENSLALRDDNDVRHRLVLVLMQIDRYEKALDHLELLQAANYGGDMSRLLIECRYKAGLTSGWQYKKQLKSIQQPLSYDERVRKNRKVMVRTLAVSVILMVSFIIGLALWTHSHSQELPNAAPFLEPQGNQELGSSLLPTSSPIIEPNANKMKKTLDDPGTSPMEDARKK